MLEKKSERYSPPLAHTILSFVSMTYNIFELLLVPFFNMLVYFPFMHSTQLSKSIKSKVSKKKCMCHHFVNEFKKGH